MPKPSKGIAPSKAAAPTAIPPATVPRAFGEREVIALLAIACCVLLTWLARSTLNPDGVSYLDLAGRLAAGDWSSFVQGYWSPLYPAMVAIISAVAGRDPVAMVATAHAINGVATIGAIGLLWWWSRQEANRFSARTMIAAFLLISAGLPRIEAVTPDVVLLALLSWIAYELLPRRGERWLLLGILLGAAFLAKTSAWPWLLLSVPLRLWGARESMRRKQVMLSSAAALVVMLTWVVPMSMKARHVTLGSAGRLNYCWYLEACDSRTPDTHVGGHEAYHQFTLDSTRTIVWAEFADGEQWTYAPWSDPTTWEAGVLSKHSRTPTPWEMLSYWGRQFRNSLFLWLLPVLIGILAPLYVLQRRPGMWRALLHDDRPVLVTGLLGLAGVMQFVVVHSEPRLIAPFGLLFALAVLHWLGRGATAPTRFPAIAWQGATALGLLGAIGFAFPRLQDGITSSARIDSVISTIASTRASLASSGLSQDRLVILGPAIPVEASAFLSGAHVVAQVPPAGVEIIKRLPADQQRQVITQLFGGKADIAWLTTADAGVTMVVIPKQ